MKKVLKKRFDIVLLAILLVGVCVRFWGIGFGLPLVTVSPDEVDVVNMALRFGTGDLNPHRFIYPSFYLYILAFVYGLYYLVGRVFGVFSTLDEFAMHVRLDPRNVFLIDRIFVALLGAATVFVVYRIAKCVFGRKAGILSALLMSLTYIHVRESHFGKLDVPMVFLLMISVYYIFKSFKEGWYKNYLLAGFFAGLAASTKYVGVLLVLPMVVAQFFKISDKKGSLLQVFFERKIVSFIGMLIIGFFLGTPYALVEVKTLIDDILLQASWMVVRDDVLAVSGWWYYLRYSLFYGLGWPLLLSSLLGVVWFLRKDFRNTVILFLLPVVYFLGVGTGKFAVSRYILPVIPFLVIFAAGFLAAIHSRYFGKLPRFISNIVLIVMVIVVIYPSFSSIIAFDSLLMKKDNRLIAGEWVAENVGGGSIYQTGSVWGKLQLKPSKTALERRLIKLSSEEENSDKRWETLIVSLQIKDLEDNGFGGFEEWSYDESTLEFYWEDEMVNMIPDYIVLEQSPLINSSRVADGILKILSESYVRIASFEAVNMENVGYFYEQQDAFYVPFAGFVGMERPGPNLYIYSRKEV